MRSIFVEAFLVHARTLLDFFEDRERFKKDILCTDFGFAARSPEALLNKKDRDRIDYQLAHLSYLREETSPDWSRSGVFDPFFSMCSEFCRHVTDLNGPEFVEERAHWAGNADRIDELRGGTLHAPAPAAGGATGSSGE